MQIPLVDLQVQYKGIKHEVMDALSGVLDGMELNPGPNVGAFEQEFAAFCGARHAIGVGSGTDALHLALRAYDVGPGDEVITVAHTFVATAEAVLLVGATPVFVDVDPVTHTMDPQQALEAITPRTKAILPVHLYGRVADMDPIVEVAWANGIRVIEDACQAHGASYRGRRVGTLGDAAAFSFYCGKNLGAYGEAGIVVTNDDLLAAHLRQARDHGSTRKYYHAILGTNARLDELQAAVLRVKLRYLEGWNAARRRHAEHYDALLTGVDGITPPAPPVDGEHVYHLYAIEADDRDGLKDSLTAAGVGTGIHYPVPAHLHQPYLAYGHGSGSLPITEAKAQRVLSLPMFPELTDEQVERVASAVSTYAARAVRAA